MKKSDILIVGTGIAGSLAAYELQKIGIDYTLITEQANPLRNVSSLSFGHFRIARIGELEQFVKRCVFELGEDEEKMMLVYSNSHLTSRLLGELGMPFEKRSFGVIPTTKGRGGACLLAKQSEKARLLMKTEKRYLTGEQRKC